MTDDDHAADYDKHTDEELEEGLRKADAQRDRVTRDDSDEALEANREQRERIEAELEERKQ